MERVLPQLKVTIRTDNKVRTHLNSPEPQPTRSVLVLVLTVLRFSRTGGSIWTRCISTETGSRRHSKTPRWVDPNGPDWFWTDSAGSGQIQLVGLSSWFWPVQLVLVGLSWFWAVQLVLDRLSWFWTVRLVLDSPAGSGRTLTPPCFASAELPGQAAGGHRENAGEGEQQREVHQQPAGGADPGIPQRSGPAQRGETHKHKPETVSGTGTDRTVLHQAKESYRQASVGVMARTRVLAEVSEHTISQ